MYKREESICEIISKMVSTHLNVNRPLDFPYRNANCHVIGHHILTGILTPETYTVPVKVVDFLLYNARPYGKKLYKRGFRYLERKVFDVEDGSKLTLQVPSDKPTPNGEPLNNKAQTLDYPGEENPNVSTATPGCGMFCAKSGKGGDTTCKADYPTHLHLVCVRCYKTFERKVFTCPTCDHVLDIPNECILFNQNGCGYIFSPYNSIIGHEVKYVNIPSTQMAFQHCDGCEKPKDGEIRELKCNWCARKSKDNGGCKENGDNGYKKFREDDAGGGMGGICGTNQKCGLFVENWDLRNAGPIRNTGKTGRDRRRDKRPTDRLRHSNQSATQGRTGLNHDFNPYILDNSHSQYAPKVAPYVPKHIDYFNITLDELLEMGIEVQQKMGAKVKSTIDAINDFVPESRCDKPADFDYLGGELIKCLLPGLKAGGRM